MYIPIMDKGEAISLSRSYIDKLRRNGIAVQDVWMFGSYARGDYHEDSDIDLAIILPDDDLSLETDVRLMSLRRGVETMIETHTYSSDEFIGDAPVVEQIRLYGFRI
jgi:predicted nucleotidyltransferase